MNARIWSRYWWADASVPASALSRRARCSSRSATARSRGRVLSVTTSRAPSSRARSGRPRSPCRGPGPLARRGVPRVQLDGRRRILGVGQADEHQLRFAICERVAERGQIAHPGAMHRMPRVTQSAVDDLDGFLVPRKNDREESRSFRPTVSRRGAAPRDSRLRKRPDHSTGISRAFVTQVAPWRRMATRMPPIRRRQRAPACAPRADAGVPGPSIMQGFLVAASRRGASPTSRPVASQTWPATAPTSSAPVSRSCSTAIRTRSSRTSSSSRARGRPSTASRSATSRPGASSSAPSGPATSVEAADVVETEMQYLYSDGGVLALHGAGHLRAVHRRQGGHGRGRDPGSRTACTATSCCGTACRSR